MNELQAKHDLVERELKLLRQEMRRQDRLSVLDHDSGCACWGCIGRLQASVVQSYLRRLEAQKKAREALPPSEPMVP